MYKTERSVGLNLTLFIYFISFLDPQAAEFHFDPKWKGSGFLSELEKRVHAHICKDCVLFVCLICSYKISSYSTANIFEEPKD